MKGQRGQGRGFPLTPAPSCCPALASHSGKKEPVNCRMKEWRARRGEAFAVELSVPIRNALSTYCKAAEAQAAACNAPNT